MRIGGDGMNNTKGNTMKPWYYATLGTSQAPVFKQNPEGDGWIGPFDEKSDAIHAADKALAHDINVLRGSLAALRRGNYV